MIETVIVIDFETTGLSPVNGARATEVAAVKIRGGNVIEQMQSLMNPGVRVPEDIERLTGITNTMIHGAPGSVEVIRALANFIGDAPLVAHNARFDQTFLRSEYVQADIKRDPPFACTLKLAKRVYPKAPNHKLQTVMDYADIPYQGCFHRALADALATASLWLQIQQDLCARYSLRYLTHKQMIELANTPISLLPSKLSGWD
jgi:DNA polymerase III subunit epsilon